MNASPIKIKVATDAITGQKLCPYCWELNTKLVRLHSYKRNGYIAHAYRCSSCGHIVWGKESLVKEEAADAED